MDFPYQNTFLRSTLAKDPFSLGELGPEDVLRIESEFPELFSSTKSTNSVLPTASTSKIPCQTGKTVPTFAKPLMGPNKTAKVVQARTGIENSCNDRKKVQTSTKGNQVDIDVEVRSWPKKKLESKPAQTPLPHGISQAKQHPANKGKPQLVSNQARTPDRQPQRPQPPAAKKSVLNMESLSCLELTPTIQELRRLVQEQYNLAHKNENQKPPPTSQRIPVSCNSHTTPDSPSLRPTQNSIITNPGISRSISPGYPSPKKTLQKSQASPLPGFLAKRGIPIGPLAAKKSVTFKRPGSGLGLKEQSVITTTSITDSETGRKPDSTTSSPAPKEDSIQTEIQIKGIGTNSSTSELGSDVVSFPDDYLSYQQLDLANKLATKYEKLGLLFRMRGNQPNAGKIAPEKRKTKPAQSGCETLPKSSEEAKEDFKILETIAKELIFIEVSKHLHNLQEQEKETQEAEIYELYHPEVDSCRCNVIPKPVHSSLESPSTPTLTQTDSSPAQIGRIAPKLSHHRPISSDGDFSTPKTPNFTQSPSKRFVGDPKYTPGNKDITDCSEISDFIFSESEIQLAKSPAVVGGGGRSTQIHGETPGPIETPPLSISHKSPDSSPSQNYSKGYGDDKELNSRNSRSCSKAKVLNEYSQRTSVDPISANSDSNVLIPTSTPCSNSKHNLAEKRSQWNQENQDSPSVYSQDSKSQCGLSEGEFAFGADVKSPGEVSQHDDIDNSRKNNSILSIRMSESNSITHSTPMKAVHPGGISTGQYI